MYDSIYRIEDHRPEDQAKQVIDQVNKCCTFTIFIRADGWDHLCDSIKPYFGFVQLGHIWKILLHIFDQFVYKSWTNYE